MRRGPGTTEQQIESLRVKMNADNIGTALRISEEYNPDVITLAYKLMRANATKSKLPKSVTKLLDKLPDNEATKIREQLAAACGK